MIRYWLKKGEETWNEVSKQDFIIAERSCALHGSPDTVATSGFSRLKDSLNDKIHGRITRDGDNSHERYKKESGFLALLNTPSSFSEEN